MPGHRRDAGASEGSGRRTGTRLFKVALLGGAVALLVREDVRNRLLDLLFGAEEEFSYSSLTEPAPPPDDHSPSEPWVRSAEPVPEPAAPPEYEPTDSDDVADRPIASGADEDEPPNTTRFTSIAPSPAAWRAAEPHVDPQIPESPDDAPETNGGSATASQATDRTATAGVPPSPPPGWWAPSKPSVSPIDG